MKLTDKEIIETTQKCLNSDCDGCDFRKFEYCRLELLKKLFCVAKQQQAEIEILKAHEEKEHQYCKNICEPKHKQEIENLNKIRSRLFYTENGELLKIPDELIEKIKKASSAEAIKEFAERLKEKADYYENGQGWEGDIYYADDVDNLVKEMVGDAE